MNIYYGAWPSLDGSDGYCTVQQTTILGLSSTNAYTLVQVYGSNDSAAMLAAKRSVGVIREVNLSNPLFAGDEACNLEGGGGSTLTSKPRADITRSPHKEDLCPLKKFFYKRFRGAAELAN